MPKISPAKIAMRAAKRKLIEDFIITFDFSVPVLLVDISLAVDKKFGATDDGLLLTAIRNIGLKPVRRGRFTYLVPSI